MKKFKIDLNEGCSHTFPYALFVEKPGWFGSSWKEIYTFETREQAKALHERIKDLPEFLF